MMPIWITFVAVFIKKLKIFININKVIFGATHRYKTGFQCVEINYISILK